MEIVGTKPNKRHAGLYDMLAATTVNNDAGDAQPKLVEDTLKSIVQGTQYPFTLYHGCLQRARATKNEKENKVGVEEDTEAQRKTRKPPKVSTTQAAVIKAYINRQHNKQKLDIMVNKEITNPGYLCGRLFATLENVQYLANGSSTISDRYMSSASTTPATVFPILLNLSVHHSEKLKDDKEGSRIYYEKLKGEIIDKLTTCNFPSHLDLLDQGYFMVGYYQQRQEFFLKASEKNQEVTNNKQ